MYVPLRVHGYHSLLTGTASPAELLEHAQALEMPALALGDVDSGAGFTALLEASTAQLAELAERTGGSGQGVRPIMAAELSDGGGRPGRLVALVESQVGYQNLCRLISTRQLGYDPGAGLPEDAEELELEAARREAAGQGFELVREAVQYQEGLLFLVDHPRLLIELFGRVEPRRLLVAVPLASLRFGRVQDPRRVARRNTHRAPTSPHSTTPQAGALDENAALDLPKTPIPARCCSAAVLLDAARATGAAVVAVPDVYYLTPEQAAEHRVRIAIKHNALLQGLPDEWSAETPAHLPSHAELCAAFAELPDVPGAWPVAPDACLQGEPASVARTRLVAEACRYTPPLGGVLFPEVELAADESPY
ncbi:MAG: DNA polymerase III alpha subunit, partial [Planctomycetota bacterium]